MKPKNSPKNKPSTKKKQIELDVLRPAKKTEQQSALKTVQAKPQSASNLANIPSTSRVKDEARAPREAIRAQKTNWRSAASRTEAKLESKRNPNVRRNKGSGKRNNRTAE
jgi:hypothetical protein